MPASSDNPMRIEHDRLGARYVEYGEAEVVADYGIDYSIDLPLENPLLIDLSFQGMLRVSGPDSGYFLHTVISCDVASLLKKGTSAPYSLAIFAYLFESVDTMTVSKHFDFSAASIV